MTKPNRRKTPYVSMNVMVPVRDSLQGLTFQLQVETGQRIAMSKVLQAAIDVAKAHPEEFRSYLHSPPTESNGETSNENNGSNNV